MPEKKEEKYLSADSAMLQSSRYLSAHEKTF